MSKGKSSSYVTTDFAALGQGRVGLSSESIDSRSLFSDSDRLTISHNGAEYLLRVTRNGKLILTK